MDGLPIWTMLSTVPGALVLAPVSSFLVGMAVVFIIGLLEEVGIPAVVTHLRHKNLLRRRFRPSGPLAMNSADQVLAQLPPEAISVTQLPPGCSSTQSLSFCNAKRRRKSEGANRHQPVNVARSHWSESSSASPERPDNRSSVVAIRASTFEFV